MRFLFNMNCYKYCTLILVLVFRKTYQGQEIIKEAKFKESILLSGFQFPDCILSHNAGYNILQSCSYQCLTDQCMGFVISSDGQCTFLKSAICTHSGEQTNNLKLFVKLEFSECSYPPAVASSYIVSTNKNVGGTTKYACNDDYIIQGSDVITCQLGGQWTPISLECIQILCPSPPELFNGFVMHISGYTPGSTAEYRCNLMFQIKYYNTLTCQADGTWSPMEFSCYFWGIGR